MPLTKRLGMRTFAGLSTLLAVAALAALGLLGGVTSQALGDDKPQSDSSSLSMEPGPPTVKASTPSGPSRARRSRRPSTEPTTPAR